MNSSARPAQATLGVDRSPMFMWQRSQQKASDPPDILEARDELEWAIGIRDVVQASADAAEPNQWVCVAGGEEASVGLGASCPHFGPRLDDRCRQPLFCCIHGDRDTDCARSDDNEIVGSLTHRWESPCWCSPIVPFRSI